MKFILAIFPSLGEGAAELGRHVNTALLASKAVSNDFELEVVVFTTVACDFGEGVETCPPRSLSTPPEVEAMGYAHAHEAAGALTWFPEFVELDREILEEHLRKLPMSAGGRGGASLRIRNRNPI